MKKIILYVLLSCIIQNVYSQNGWEFQYNPLGNEVLGKVQFLDLNNGWVIVQNGKLLHTQNGGSSWEIVIPSVNHQVKFFTDPATSMCFIDSVTGFLIGTITDSLGDGIHGIIFKTVDGGNSWSESIITNCIEAVSIQFVSPDIGWITYLNSEYEGLVLQTSDGGQNWIEVHKMQGKLGIPSFVDYNNGWLWQNKLDQNMDFIPPFEIYKTGDGGKTWELQYINDSIAIDARSFFIDSSTGWISGKTEVGNYPLMLHTTNGGKDWIETIGNNDPIFIDLRINTIFFLNSNIGWLSITILGENENNYLLYTNNNGISWIIQMTPCNQKINSIQFINENYGWITGEEGCIAFTQTGGNITRVDNETNLGPNIYLSQNYPNPFNPSTTIKYSIQKQSNVILKVFDVLGREVTILVNKVHSQGNYEVELDGRELTSGIYFYRLAAGDFIETKKMILLK